MSTRGTRISMLGCLAALLLVAAPLAAQTDPANGSQDPPLSAGDAALVVDAWSPDAAAPSQAVGISEAELYYRRGVELYKQDLHREALTEFNRALALEPGHAEARRFQEKATAQLQQALVGMGSARTTEFSAIDPETVRQQGETMQLSSDEIRRERVNNLLSDAIRYLEAERYPIAVEIYSNVLLIDPTNPVAKDGLHKATIAAHKQEGEIAAKGVNEDRAMIHNFIEKSKQLPAGADARGIKPYRFSVPQIEEETFQEQEKTEIEKLLDSPVNIEFEDIHLNEIATFIADLYDMNIVIDNRSVEPPVKVEPQQQAPGAGAPGMPGAFPGAPGAPGAAPFPGAPIAAQPVYGLPQQPQGLRGAGVPGQPGFQAGGQFGYGDDVTYGTKSSGVIPYINLKNVSLGEALQALLRPLGLDYSVQPGFIWVSKPEIIRRESFEKIETRYYELRNAGSETLFKLVLRNRFGGVGGGGMGGMGGMGGGMYGGGMGGGMYGGGMGGMGGMGGGMYGGGMGGGMYGGGMGGMGGGMYGGGMGGMGGGMGGYGGSMGGMGGGMYGGGMGGMGGGMGGGMYGGGMGGMGMGGMGGMGMGGGMGGYGGGGSDVTSISNISDLFSSISDMMVGEMPATTMTMGLRSTGTGATAGRNQTLGGGGFASAQDSAGLGMGGSSFGMGSDILSILERLVPQVYEPYTEELLSDMIYNPSNNLLIVKNTPTNLATFEKQLAQIDVTPKQVSIEAKFLTIRLDDLKKVGFKWDATLSDQNNRTRQSDYLSQQTYSYDVNGDGVDEEIPFYTRPDGSNVIRNTITDAAISSITNPATTAVPTFSILGNIIDNADGDKLSLTFDYLDSLDESELLSAPRVTTMNRKPAVVADFVTEYYVSSVNTQIITQTGNFTSNNSQSFIQNVTPTSYNFGIALSVTPQIRDNDQVRLWLNPEVRTRTGEKKFVQKQVIDGQTIDNELVLPTTSWQAVWTNVIVHDGDTLVLGGLVQDATNKGQQKMPYLADIPVIGFFFKGNKRESKQSSLLIFVTPDIIDSTGARFFDIAGDAPRS